MRRQPIVLRSIDRSYFVPPGRGRLDRFAYGMATGFVLAFLLFGLGLVRAEEVERAQLASRGDRPAVLERAEVVDLAAEIFGPDVAHYVANIARCESSYRPAARSSGWDRVFGWYSYVGLMQVEQGIWGPVALALFDSDDLTDPRVNLSIARVIQQRQGWRAWPVCSR